MNTFCVSLSLEETVLKINNAVSVSVSGSLIDNYSVTAPNGKKCTVLVYEKYYFRVKNYVTLTVVLDNFDGKTRVHMVGSGGGNGFLNLDFGASKVESHGQIGAI